MVEENKAYKIKCPYCGHEFIDYFDVTGYEYNGGDCCRKCGEHIDVNISKEGVLKICSL